MTKISMETFALLESEVRGYCRSWPTVFEKAEGSTLIAQDGREYIDFFAGAGSLNYGHNNPQLKSRLVAYLLDNGIVHSLDMATVAKGDFLERFQDVILRPQGMRYKVQFPGPTGTNSVEAALKLARKVTGRQKVVGFTNAFHGMTLGALAVTGNAMKRGGAGISLGMGVSMPFEGFLGRDADTIEYLERFLEDGGSGLDTPAAIIVETVQAEGGINVASYPWLRRLEAVCRRYDSLLIIDDIQVGCGRTGPFFSFEGAGITPDIICLSKSLSGYGLPMAVTLLKPELDIWDPGEHNGTFRGNNAAFVTATAALRYWETDQLRREVTQKAAFVENRLKGIVADYPDMAFEHRGRGLLQGLKCPVENDFAGRVVQDSFGRGLIIETSGPNSEVVKLLPPLTIDESELSAGLAILEESFSEVRDSLRTKRLTVASSLR